MPHFIIEYSSNLEERADVQALCGTIHDAALATGVFEPGGIRVRAYPARHFAIADTHERNAFVHMQLRLGSGRSLETLKEAGEKVFAALRGFLESELAEPYFCLSFEMAEIHSELTWKENSIHRRLRGPDKGGR